jgi:hypothetical protein
MSGPLTLTLSHRGARKKSSPFRKGGKEDLNFLLLSHYEEPNRSLVGLCGNLIHSVCHTEESGVFYRTTRVSHPFHFHSSTIPQFHKIIDYL